jgi:hypothetical protein
MAASFQSEVSMTLRLAFAVLIATSLQAAPRTFVASNGLDSNPCTRTSPCRSFSTALVATDLGGEIIVIDSAGYGPVTIMQPVSIISPAGVYAGISASSGDAIQVNISEFDRVTLKGLTINGAGTAFNGIDFISTGRLNLEDISVTGFTVNQILSNGGGSLSLHRCALHGRSGGANGIVVTTATGTAMALIASSVIDDASECVYARAGSIVTVVDSHVGPCFSRAFRVSETGDLTIERSVGTNSSEGLLSGCDSGIARISNSTFSGNATGVRNCSATIYTRTNNTIFGNTFEDLNGTLTPFGAQ